MIFELILPCYNESKSLERLILHARDAATEFGFTSSQFQLVMVENGSKDDSRKVFSELLQREDLKEWFRIVFVDQNQGYGFGLWSGLATSKADYIGWSHADQQCDMKDAFRGLKLLRENEPQHEHILVKGSRLGRNWKDRTVSDIFAFFARCIVGLKMREINAQPKVFPRNLMTYVKNPPNTFAFDLYVMICASRNHFKILEIPVRFEPRVHGFSNWAHTLRSR